jgi:hypothetical protein
MRGISNPTVRNGLLATLLPVALAAPAKPPAPPPPAGCPTCEIVYTQTPKGSTGRVDLMLMTKDGGSKTLLLAGASGIGQKQPSWAPDGRWIAFYTSAIAGGSVRVIRSDGTGLTTVATTCTNYTGGHAWRPVSVANGYWLVYLDARRSDGSCIVETSPYRSNLWAVDVSLDPTVLLGGPVCLTCELNPDDADLWVVPAWSRDGNHFSALQHRYGVSDNFYVFDVSFESGFPVLGHAWPFAPPEFDPTFGASWAHWSDSAVVKTRAVNATNALMKYEVDLVSEPEQLGSTTNLTAGRANYFDHPRWSADDTALVSGVGSTGSTATDGIYVITLYPFSMKLIASSSPTAVSSPDWKPPLR